MLPESVVGKVPGKGMDLFNAAGVVRTGILMVDDLQNDWSGRGNKQTGERSGRGRLKSRKIADIGDITDDKQIKLSVLHLCSYQE
jgi:hypothetical protein